MSAILKRIKTKLYILHYVGRRDRYNESICQVSKLYLKLFLIKNSYKIIYFTLGPLSWSYAGYFLITFHIVIHILLKRIDHTAARMTILVSKS